jgi:SAM-dependent methyltransferase
MSEDWRDAFSGAGLENYEQVLVPRVFAPMAEELLDLVDVHAGERLLDVGCGPGTVAVAAERRGARATGCDPSPDMLAFARAKSSTIEWIETAAAPLVGVPDEAFDVVTCQHALQFVPDRPAAMAEMHRVLVPGGRVAVATWGPLENSPAFAAVQRGLREFAGDEAAERLRNGPWGFPDPDALGSLLDGAGFDGVEVVQRTVRGDFDGGPEQLLGVLVISPVGDDLAAFSPEQAEAFLDAVRRDTAPLTEDGVVRNTMEANVAIGVKA